MNEKKECHKYLSIGMSVGMCFGMSIGLAIENLLLENGWGGMSIGLAVGMIMGMVIGMQKDKAINNQIKEKGYRIQEIIENTSDEKNSDVRIEDVNGEVIFVTIDKKRIQKERFEVGDLVYIDTNKNVELIFDKPKQPVEKS